MAGRDGRATGKRLDEVPAFLGTFYSANLAHPEHGVRRRSDGQLARVLRNGVLPDGRLSVRHERLRQAGRRGRGGDPRLHAFGREGVRAGGQGSAALRADARSAR